MFLFLALHSSKSPIRLQGQNGGRLFGGQNAQEPVQSLQAQEVHLGGNESGGRATRKRPQKFHSEAANVALLQRTPKPIWPVDDDSPCGLFIAAFFVGFGQDAVPAAATASPNPAAQTLRMQPKVGLFDSSTAADGRNGVSNGSGVAASVPSSATAAAAAAFPIWPESRIRRCGFGQFTFQSLPPSNATYDGHPVDADAQIPAPSQSRFIFISAFISCINCGGDHDRELVRNGSEIVIYERAMGPTCARIHLAALQRPNESFGRNLEGTFRPLSSSIRASGRNGPVDVGHFRRRRADRVEGFSRDHRQVPEHGRGRHWVCLLEGISLVADELVWVERVKGFGGRDGVAGSGPVDLVAVHLEGISESTSTIRQVVVIVASIESLDLPVDGPQRVLQVHRGDSFGEDHLWHVQSQSCLM